MSTRIAILFVALAVPASAAEPAWEPALGDFIKDQKPAFGGLCGVVVDHATGRVWINISDRGLYVSEPGAKEFKRVSATQPRGRTETPGCLMLGPKGKMVSAFVYGSPIGVSDDGGKTWTFMNKESGHVDWCAVDLTDAGMKFVLTLKHEKGGMLLLSGDGGKSFTEAGKGYGPGWVFDGKTAVVARVKTKDGPKPGLVRTTDGGKTWKPAGDHNPVGNQSAQVLPRWHGGKLYWLVEGALIRTGDKGETWEKLGAVKGARYGPVFGKDEGHLFVLTDAGVVESKDGGKSWGKPIALPKGLKGAAGLSWLEYDPKGDILYVMKMGSDLYRLRRK
jgi:photosystem II stability/assembly factor-like uncharacterized protein